MLYNAVVGRAGQLYCMLSVFARPSTELRNGCIQRLYVIQYWTP